jgi:2-polyprenyl-3-methyl-5-hydroxy-6-metoxy-1,4-benzoquinol methylase
MQKREYLYGTNNHEIHNENPDYWNILLKSFITNKISKSAKILDYGCGRGRNVINLNALGYKNVYGVDISRSNINYCNKTWHFLKINF